MEVKRMEIGISFQDFLVWLQHPGIEVAVGVLSSVIVEYIPRFEKLERKWKAPVIFGFNVGVPVIAAGISVALGYQLADFDATFWPAIVAGVLAFAGSQGAWVRREIIRMKALRGG
jgi:hypothetical protein